MLVLRCLKHVGRVGIQDRNVMIVGVGCSVPGSRGGVISPYEVHLADRAALLLTEGVPVPDTSRDKSSASKNSRNCECC